jgi:methionyl aminopeptidase
MKPKTPAQLEAFRASGAILRKAHKAMQDVIKPGVTMLQLDAIAETLIRDHGGVPAFKGFGGFPASICAMFNEQVVHGIPNDRPIQTGDLLSIDCGVFFNGMVSDAAFSLVVGGKEANPKRFAFEQAVKQALLAGCAAAKAGNKTGDIGHAVQQVIKQAGYSICKQYTGHGVGATMHEEPHIYNYGNPGSGVLLREGMTICIEPIIAMGRPKTKELADQWTVVTVDGSDACQWEHCGIVTKSGLEIVA